jgi:hypothetical protein
MALDHAQRIMTNSNAPATSTSFTSVSHFSTNTFRIRTILSEQMAQRQVLLWAVLFY